MTGFYHICFAVPDIERAMRDLQRAVGTEWGTVRADTIGEWDFRIVFSRGGPPFVELIEGPPGSPWDSAGGARCHHIGYWSESAEAGSRRLAAEGLPVDFSGCPYGRPFAYHRVDSIGTALELVDVARQPAFREAWDPDGAPMPAVRERDGD